jgi:hypothetical protein
MFGVVATEDYPRGELIKSTEPRRLECKKMQRSQTAFIHAGAKTYANPHF